MAADRSMSLLMTLSDAKPGFKVTVYYKSNVYLTDKFIIEQ